MKKNYFLFLLAMFSCAITFAQVPQAVPYQAVARNSAGNLISNQSISVRLSILDATSAGPAVYSETHTSTTNQFGLFTVNLGQGSILSGTFPGINWAVNAKYLKVEFDPAGGNSFVNMGTSQLLSVPYALFSGSGANLPNGTLAGNTLRWNGTNWIADNGIYNDGNKIGLGTTVPGSGSSPSAKLDIQDEDGNNSDINQTVAGAGFPALIWTKQRGTLAAPQAVTKNTFVGGIQGNYFNGTDYNIGAAMYYVADTTSSTSFPASIQFRTTSVDSTRNLTRMIIKHNGKIGIGTTTPGVNGSNPYARLDIRDEDGSNSDINQLVAGQGIPAITWAQQGGTLAAPEPVNTGSVFGRLDGNYYTANGYSQGNSRAASIFFRADTLVNSGNPGSIYFATARYGETIPRTNLIIKHNGNVGVGTQNPEQKFDVRGKVKILDGTEGLNKVFTSDATGVGSWQTLPAGNVPNGNLLGNTLRWNGAAWIADNAIYSDGLKVGLGTTEPGFGVNPTAKIDLRDEDGSNSDISQTVAGGGGFPALVWTKQRGTLATPTAVTKNTFLGGIQGNYYNGTDYNIGAAMYYIADTTSSTSFPASIQFRTTSVDSTRNLTRMVIKHNGNVGIGTQNPERKLDVVGGVKIVDGTQGAGKVLTSDAAGNASWQVPVSGGGGNPHIAFFAGNTDFALGNQSIPAGTTQIVQFGNGYAFFNDGAGYNLATNKFTPPVSGVYQINVTLNFQGVPGEVVNISLRLGNGGHIVKGAQVVDAGGNGVITLAATYNSMNSTEAPIWVDVFSTFPLTLLKPESGFSAHLVYANPL